MSGHLGFCCCGAVSQQNCNNLTSPSDNSVRRSRRICSADGCGALLVFYDVVYNNVGLLRPILIYFHAYIGLPYVNIVLLTRHA